MTNADKIRSMSDEELFIQTAVKPLASAMGI